MLLVMLLCCSFFFFWKNTKYRPPVICFLIVNLCKESSHVKSNEFKNVCFSFISPFKRFNGHIDVCDTSWCLKKFGTNQLWVWDKPSLNPKLTRAMYGAVQSGIAWYKTITKCLVNKCKFVERQKWNYSNDNEKFYESEAVASFFK